MVTTYSRRRPHRSSYAGLRLTADEYFELASDGNKYELIDGVVVMSPSPTPKHQLVAKSVLRQLDDYVEAHHLGLVLYETDVQLYVPAGAHGLVYRPEIVFIAADRAVQIKGRIKTAPDVVVEVISPDSRSLDEETKLADYERAGVIEYWLIDPIEDRMTFYRLEAGRFVEAAVSGGFFESTAVPGFRLDLEKVRVTFTML
jgi:Uma2 family endonuclease